jgi:general stress protein 26
MVARGKQLRAGRPQFPPGYGISRRRAGLLSWRFVQDRMKKAKNYWVSTTRSGGRPHTMPVWGVWMDDRLYFCTDRASRKARNLSANPAVVAHLESGDEVVIIEGRAAEVTARAEIRKLERAYCRKYKVRFADIPGDILVCAIRPQAALAWTEKSFPTSATRWRFLGRRVHTP